MDEQEEEEEEEEAPEPSVTSDARVDALWDDINASTAVSKEAAAKTAKLLGGLGKPKRKGTIKKQPKRKLREFQMPILSVDVKRSRTDLGPAGKKKVEQLVKFAGQEYSVSTSAQPKARKGLDTALAALDEPKQVSTMEKTSLDWDKFKEAEGIEDELTQYTKDGYIEKQEFLQRLDLKRFEIEKAERDKQRKLQQK